MSPNVAHHIFKIQKKIYGNPLNELGSISFVVLLLLLFLAYIS